MPPLSRMDARHVGTLMVSLKDYPIYDGRLYPIKKDELASSSSSPLIVLFFACKIILIKQNKI